MENILSHALILLPLLLALGALSGFMAGLLGIGGGIILVPGLYHTFKLLGYDESLLMHLSVGTSLAIIIPTGLASARAHYKKGAVRFDLVRSIGPGIVLGVITGTWIADMISGESLTIIFASALVLFALLMQIPQKAVAKGEGEDMLAGPKQPVASIGGYGVGILSSLMGIGGASLNVPFMALNGVNILQAVASSSAMGPLIALPGTIGFIIIGLNSVGLPPFSIGYINLIAFLVIAPLSVLCAPLGAKVAHKVSIKRLRMIFAVFLLIVAAKMVVEAFNG